MADPVILGLDTSGHHCAAALRWGDDKIAYIQEDMAKGQAERLVFLLQELLDQEGFSWSDLNAIAVGIGPGNFTGIRIGVSTTRGLALGLGIPAIGISSFELLRGANSTLDHMPQLVSLPAPRETNYVQHFVSGKASAAPLHLKSATAGLIDFELEATTSIIGDNAHNLCRLYSKDDRKEYPAPRFASLQEIPQTLVRIATEKFKVGTSNAPAPLYVRAPDASPPRDAPPTILL